MNPTETIAFLCCFANEATRREAVTILGRRLGCTDIVLFVPDAQVNVLVPAPGFSQTVPGGSEWRGFLGACRAEGTHSGTVRFPDPATLQPAVGCTASDGTVLVIIGKENVPPECTDIRAVLPILGALLRSEQRALAATGQAAAARQAEIHACNLATALDTARASQERALREAARLTQEVLEREADLKKKAEFEQHLIGIVSHDLRNPLHAIALSTSLLSNDKDSLTERQRKIVGRMKSAAERANRMILDLLDFTRARLGGGISIQRTEMDFDTAIEQIVEELRVTYPTRIITHRKHVSGEGYWDRNHVSGEGRWDPDRVAQIVTNLVANAVAYSAPDTEIVVSTAGNSEGVTLCVHNGGAPIDESILPHLFEPLKRGANSVGSSSRSIGLGLYIVRELVAAHGGTIEVRSTQAEGTTFVVRLPRREGILGGEG